MISRSATSHGRLVTVAVTVPVTAFEGRIVRPVKDANIAITSLIGALSQLMPVMRGSWDCFIGVVDLLSATGISIGAGSVLATGFSTTGFSAAGVSIAGFSATGFSSTGCGFGASTTGAACC